MRLAHDKGMPDIWTKPQIIEHRAELLRSLQGWREPDGFLVATEPDPRARALVRIQLRTAIDTLAKVAGYSDADYERRSQELNEEDARIIERGKAPRALAEVSFAGRKLEGAGPDDFVEVPPLGREPIDLTASMRGLLFDGGLGPARVWSPETLTLVRSRALDLIIKRTEVKLRSEAIGLREVPPGSRTVLIYITDITSARALEEAGVVLFPFKWDHSGLSISASERRSEAMRLKAKALRLWGARASLDAYNRFMRYAAQCENFIATGAGLPCPCSDDFAEGWAFGIRGEG